MLSRILRRWFASRRTKISQATRRRRLFLEPLEDRSVLSTFLVTNTDSSGPGSLRQAILDAEFTPNVGGPDRIEFNISASDPGHVYYRDDGVAGHVTQANVMATAVADDAGIADIDPDWTHSWYTIYPTDTLGGSSRSLPEIINPVIIDGYTQPGASPNTLAVGDNAVLKIEINGSLLPGTNLFNFSGNNSTVRGLAITHVNASVLSLGNFGSLSPANHTTIVGNFFSTDAGGLTYQGGDGPAISIIAGSDNVIGGPAPADRNVIAPGRFVLTASITMQSGTGNVVQGNYIGVNKDGTAPLQSPFGGFAIGIGAESGSNIIGGTTPGAGNVIFATLTGIKLGEGNTGHNVVQGNLLGTNAIGTAGLGGGQFGLDVQSSSDTITGNVISGFSTGISINHQGPPGPGPTIQGNKIGTDVTGTLAIPNSGDGIFILGSAGGATIGGTNPGDGNTIANNGRFGIFINFGTGCSILGNSIFANGNLGINLNGSSDGFTGPVTPNDPGDGDGDANGLQNYPVITSAISGGSNTIITGTLNSTPDASFRIEFFASDDADSSGFGEGQVFLGAITTNATDGNGDVSFAANLPVALTVGQVVSATATDQFGNTSEFALTIAGLVTNTAPFITSLDGPTSGLTGEQLFYTGDFSDPDSNTWTGTVNFGDGSGDQPLALNPDQTFAFDHIFTVHGTYTVTVTIADNHGSFDSDSLTVTITDNNTAPVITQFVGPPTFVAGVEEGFFTGTFSDPDPDTWTGTINFGDGTGDQQLHLAPNKTFQIGKIYASPGTYTVTVTIADNHGGEDTRSLTVTITDNNTAPVITQFVGPPTFVAGVEEGFFTGTFSDPDPDTWTGTINFGDGTGDQQLHLAPNKTFQIGKIYASPGTYTVTVTIADNHGGEDTRSLTVTITDNNTAPVITQFVGPPTFVAGVEEGFFTGTFSDPDPDTWTGTINFGDGTGDQQLHLAPNKTFQIGKIYASPGTYTVTVTIADNHSGEDTRSLTVTITDNNTAPVAVADAATLTTGTTRTINVLANDSDPDGNALAVTAVTQPASGHGIVTINANGTLTYTQTVFVNGTEIFTYTISDGHGGTATATVTVTVRLPARIGIDMLRSQVQHAGLRRGLQISLDSTLRVAQQVLARGNSRAAANLLGAFANEVRALKRAHLLPPSLADLWLWEDANILANLNR